MKKTILAIIGITIGALAGLSFTGCHHGGACYDGDDASDHAARERRINHVKERIADVLALSDSQVSELDRMIENLKAKHDELKSRRPELKAQFIEAFGQDRLQADDITMSRLRHKLGDDPKSPAFIKTVWGTGYVFIGYGLGLSLAKTIIEAHGGSIAITSTISQGTTVRIALPILC